MTTIRRRWWQVRWVWVKAGEAYFDRNGRKRRCQRSGLRSVFYFTELL